MLNKIEKFKGFENYKEGIERWSVDTDSYLFGIKETGIISDEDKKEKEYYRYEYSRIISPIEVSENFIKCYLEYNGYDLNTQIAVSLSEDKLSKLKMEQKLIEAQLYAIKLNPIEDEFKYIKKLKENEIRQYDVSSEVNSFKLNGKDMWLDRELRVSLSNSTKIEQTSGKEETTLWYEGICYQIPINTALQMLAALELYALECHNVTQKHISELSKLSTIKDVLQYNYKVEYPNKLEF